MRDSLGFRIAAAGGILAIIGSLGPWAAVGDLSIGGTDSGKDGTIVIVCAVLALLALVGGLMRGKRGLSIVGLLLAGLCVLIGVIDYSDISNTADELNKLGAGTVDVEVKAKWGIYVALAGSIILAVGALMTTIGGRKGPG